MTIRRDGVVNGDKGPKWLEVRDILVDQMSKTDVSSTVAV